MKQNFELVISREVEKVKLGGQLGQDVQYIYRQHQSLLLADSQKGITELRQNISLREQLMDERVQKIRSLLEPDEAESFENIAKQWNQYVIAQNEIIKNALSKGIYQIDYNDRSTPAKRQVIYEALLHFHDCNTSSTDKQKRMTGESGLKILNVINDFVDQIDNKLENEVTNTNNLYRKAIIEMVILFVLALFATAILSILISRYIMRQ